MKKIKYLILIILLIQFACKTKKSFVKSDTGQTIKSTKVLLFKPDSPISQAIDSNRDSVLTVRFDIYKIYNKYGKIMKTEKFEKDGKMWEQRIIIRDENGKFQKGLKNNSKNELKEYWTIKTDKKGNVIQSKTHNNNDELTNIQESKYDTKGNNISFVNKSLKYNNIFKTIYEYNSKNELVKRIKYKNNTLKDERTYKYDNKGNEIEQYLYRDGSITKYISEYDKMNNILESYWFNENGEQTHQTSFIYVYDKYGNWLTKKRSSNGVLSLIWERKIEYYKK